MQMMEEFEVENCPTTELSRTNRAILNPRCNFALQKVEHIAVREAPRGKEAFIFTVIVDPALKLDGPTQKIGFNLTSRKWAKLLKGKKVEAAPYQFDFKTQCLNSITFFVDLNSRKDANSNVEYNAEEMAKQFSAQFCNQAFTVSQLFGFSFVMPNQTRLTFELKVKEMEALNVNRTDEVGTLFVEIGLFTANTIVMFEVGEGAPVKLVGGKNNFSAPKVICQNWDFATMGVGGLSEQFNKIFRRAFASRLLPPQFAEKIKAEHVRGILLYGPPGTGKTLIARQIGKMLLSREPKVVNGPEVLNKYVGESEANIRKLFQEAEEEFQKAGLNSGLHVIIFDEIDAICKARGNSASSAGVSDNVVNQLLSKIDGVNSLPNVLLIGMTNRRDLIDEALLRPGRLEVQIEIGIPNQEGRLEIFKIHTRELRAHNVLDPSVSLEELAEKTKNYTGAEIAGLVKAARDLAVNRIIKADAKIEITEDMLNSIRVTRDDFQFAMDNDIKPALGASEDELKDLADTIIPWDSSVSSIQSDLELVVKQVSRPKPGKDKPYYMLLIGEPGAGLTTIAADVAARTNFPFIRIYKAGATAGKPESAKVQYIEKLFEDAARSELSCIVIDGLEYITSYSHVGPQFSNTIRAVLATNKNRILPQGRRMLVVCTCNSSKAIDDLQISKVFNNIVRVPSLMTPEHVQTVLDHLNESGESPFTESQCEELVSALGSIPFKMGIKEFLQLVRDVVEYEPGQRVKVLLQRMHTLDLVIRNRNRDIQF